MKLKTKLKLKRIGYIVGEEGLVIGVALASGGNIPLIAGAQPAVFMTYAGMSVDDKKYIQSLKRKHNKKLKEVV